MAGRPELSGKDMVDDMIREHQKEQKLPMTKLRTFSIAEREAKVSLPTGEFPMQRSVFYTFRRKAGPWKRASMCVSTTAFLIG